MKKIIKIFRRKSKLHDVGKEKKTPVDNEPEPEPENPEDHAPLDQDRTSRYEVYRRKYGATGLYGQQLGKPSETETTGDETFGRSSENLDRQFYRKGARMSYLGKPCETETTGDETSGRSSENLDRQFYGERARTSYEIGHSKLLVAAIDFGTTYSGWAFSFIHEYELDPCTVSTQNWHAGGSGPLVSEKTPTCLLIEPDGKTLSAFGYEAQNKYHQLVQDGMHKEYYFFERFKMMLNRKLEEGLPRFIDLEDNTGKSLKAEIVFSLAIRFLKDNMIDACKLKLAGKKFQESDVQWVLTVPAIWSDAAKQFMRETAIKAGIDTYSLKIALEPEAASIFCRHFRVEKKTTDVEGVERTDISRFEPGTKYMILDAGGGTVDITVHEVKTEGRLKQVHRATGGAWGGTVVNENFKEMLITIIGESVYLKFKQDYAEDWLDLFRDFEIKKRNVTPNTSGKVTFKIPMTLVELFQRESGSAIEEAIQNSKYAGMLIKVSDKFRCDVSLMWDLFSGPIESIISHLKTLMKKPAVQNISAILMVGGFSESNMLQDAVQREFPRLKIVIPVGAGLCVLKGAVIFGHKPESVDERILQFTYGFNTQRDFNKGQDPEHMKRIVDGKEKCSGVFSKHAEINDIVRVGENHVQHTYFPSFKTQTSATLALYASENRNPRYVVDPGCTKIGTLTVDMLDTTGGFDRPILVSLIFGDTEIHVEAIEKNTGNFTTASFDFLE